jgi:hypothetical protein
MLRFTVYDIDGPLPDLSNHELIGSMECTLGELQKFRDTGTKFREIFSKFSTR